LTNNQIILLNDIILKIHTAKDFEDMRKIVLSSLRFLVPCVGIAFYLASRSEQYRLTDGLGIGISEECMSIYLEEFQEYDQTIWSYATPVSKVYNESAFIQNEAKQNTDFYYRIYAPLKIFYQAALTIIQNGIFLGVIAIFRTKGEGEFQPEELFNLELLASHLGARMYQHLRSINVKQTNNPDREILLNNYHLTLRETEVLYAILNEKEKQEICEHLCISPNTLKKHIMNLYKKFQVHSLVGLFQAAAQIKIY
jgi:DNA-binding CsgD family transcriptional regulator